MKDKFRTVDFDRLRAEKARGLQTFDFDAERQKMRLLSQRRAVSPSHFAHADPGVSYLIEPMAQRLYLPNKLTGQDYYRIEIGNEQYGYMVVYFYVPLPKPDKNNLLGANVPSSFAAFPDGPHTVHVGPQTRRFCVGIHGAGDEHYRGAHTILYDMSQTTSFADDNNLIVLAPTFAHRITNIDNVTCPHPYGYLAGRPHPFDPDHEPPWDGRPDWVTDNSQEDFEFLYAFYIGGYWFGPGKDPYNHWPFEPGEYDYSTFLDWIHAEGKYNLFDFNYAIHRKRGDEGQDDGFRTDLALRHLLIDFFKNLFPDVEDRFLLYGHSGGAQFVSRYLLMWPNDLSGVAFSSAGSFLFPREDHYFPLGLRVDPDYLTAPEQDYVINDWELLDELTDNPTLWYDLFHDAYLFPKIYAVGLAELDPNHADRAWQGDNTICTARNYIMEMGHMEARMKRYFGDHWVADKCQGFCFLENIGQDHPNNRTTTWNWLRRFWLNYPAKVPYFNYATNEWQYPPPGPVVVP